MKSAKSFNGTDTDKAVMLTNKGSLKTLDIRIGEIRVELWEPGKPNATPYACLVFPTLVEDPNVDSLADPSHHARPRVTLDQMYASALANALASWVYAIQTRVKAGASPALYAEFPSLLVKLHGPSADNVPLRAELTFTGASIARTTATLTYLEANLLVESLNTILPGNQEEVER